MAEIKVTERTDSSLTVCLSGLDTSYSGTARTARWYLKESGETEYFLWETQIVPTQGQSEFPSVLLDGLFADTNYTVRCAVSNEIGQEFGPWERNVWTRPEPSAYTPEIDVVSRTSWSLTVHLTGLDPSYSGTTRTAWWYIKKSTEETYQLWESQIVPTQGQTEFPTVLLDGLDQDTRYNIHCIVSNEIGQEFGPFEASASTPAFQHEITNTSVVQTKFTPDFIFLCQWTVGNYIPGDTRYQILVKEKYGENDFGEEWTKAEGVMYSSSGEVEIAIENMGTYVVALRLDTWNAGVTRTLGTVTTELAWELTAGGIGTLTEGYTKTLSISNFKMNRWRVLFERDGTASFYTTGLTGTVATTSGYLTTTTNWNQASGIPTDALAASNEEATGIHFQIDYQAEAGRTYYIWVREASGWGEGTAQLHIIPPAGAVSPWDWNLSNGTAAAAQTKSAYSAITGKGNVSEFSYLVWNDLVEKVRQAYTYANAGQSIAVYEEKLDAAKMTPDDKVLTAVRFNNVRFVIGSTMAAFGSGDTTLYEHYMTSGSWDMQAGERLLGSYINELTVKLNQGIGQL